MDVHRAGDLVGRAHHLAQHLDADLVGQPEHDHGRRRLGARHDLEGRLGDDREGAPAAGDAARDVVAGDVLHHAATGLDQLAMTGDGAHAEQVVAGRARVDAARAGQIGRESRADRALSGVAAE